MSETGLDDAVADRVTARIVALLSEPSGASEPLYLRLEQAIRRLIEQGELRPSQTLPSERALVRATGMSRVTVRTAMERLIGDALISTRPGAGSQVSPLLEQPLSVLLGFTEDMKRRGAATESRLISQEVGLPTTDEMLKLGLAASEPVFRLSRIRLANGEAMAIEHAVVPQSAIGTETVEGSLYDRLRHTGNMPVRALQRLRSSIAEDWEARHLCIPAGSPILRIERHAFLASGRSIEVTRSAYRGDRYDFIAELKLPT